MSALEHHLRHRNVRANEATAHATRELADADRHRELRARGFITERSTPGQIFSVEHRLAAQMRARRERAGETRREPYAYAVGLSALVSTLCAIIAGIAGSPTWGGYGFMILAAFVVPAVAIFVLTAARERHRATVIARADWTADWACGWCGTRTPHLVDGVEEHPRVAHAVEVEREMGGR